MATTINPSDQTITQYNVQTGAASNLLNNVAPSATSGVPLISQGSSAQPIFGTTVVAGGGTGDTSFTSYSVITGGTTSTGALQQVSGVGTNGQVLTSAGAGALPTWSAAPVTTVGTITGNDGAALSQSSNNWNIEGYGAAVTGYSPYSTGSGSTMRINMPGTVKWVVNATANLGTHTAIQAAITAASSGDDVFITAGTYTEDLTLKVGVNLVAYGCDSVSQVIIIGKATLTAAGTVNIYGVQLRTNSDFFLAVTGSAASIVNLNNCYLNALNNTGISYSSSSGSSVININYCAGDVGTTGIGMYTATGAGQISFFYSHFTNTGSSTTASSSSACQVAFNYTSFNFLVSYSASGTASWFYAYQTTTGNNTGLAITGTGTSTMSHSYIGGGSNAVITVGSGATLNAYFSNLNCSVTAVTGAGTFNFTALSMGANVVNQSSVTTQTMAGTLLGLRTGHAPTAGMLGESMYSAISSANAVNIVTTNTFVNITSLTLTPGVWDLCGVGVCTSLTTGTSTKFSIDTTNTGAGTLGDSEITLPSSATSNVSGTIAGYRVTVSSNTTYYFNGTQVFTAGPGAVFGRLSATRVG